MLLFGSKNDDKPDWLFWILVVLFLVCVAPIAAAEDKLRKSWTPERKRFWVSTGIGIVVLVAVLILLVLQPN